MTTIPSISSIPSIPRQEIQARLEADDDLVLVEALGSPALGADRRSPRNAVELSTGLGMSPSA